MVMNKRTQERLIL